MRATAVSYFEDLVVGEVHQTPAITLTQAHVTQFLGLAGERPDHAREGVPPVPDLLPLCLSSGLGFRVGAPPLAVLAFMGIEWRLLEPLHVGDTILSRSTMVTKRSMREGGVLVEAREVYDQRGRLAQSGRLTLLIARRPAGGP